MWADIFTNFIGAFFGFLFAIVIEIGVSKKDDKETQTKVRDNIINELTLIGQQLKQIRHNHENPLYFRYQFTAWETCVNSGYLFSVSGKTIYNQFTEIYSQIIFADELEKQYFELYMKNASENRPILLKQTTEAMNTARLEKRDKILEEIQQICDLQ